MMFRVFDGVAFSVLVACYIGMLYIFFTAFFNGFEVVVLINGFHEAWLEFFILILSFPMVVFWFYRKFFLRGGV